MSKKIKIFSLLILFFAILLFSKNNYCATDGSLKASQSKSGNKITVTVTCSKKLGAFTLKASELTAIDGSSDVGAYGNNAISGASASGVTTLGKFIFNVPSKDTTITFSVSGLATDVNDNDLKIDDAYITLKAPKTTTNTNNNTTNKNTNTTTDNKNNTTTTTTTKNETTTKTKSNNANLSTLGVTPKEYDFSGFSKNKTSYNVTVPSDVESLKVVYKTADPNAKVKVTGNSGFEVGSNNKITVKVTAEDGKTTKTYTIKVTKLAEDAEKPGNLIEDNEGLYLTSLELEGVTLSPEFAKDIYSYTATLSSTDITEVNVKATANNDKAKIDISGNTELTEGENTINVIVRLEDSSVQTVYQIVLTKEATTVTDVETISAEENNLNTTDLVGTIKNYIKIIIAVVIGIILLIIILIILLKKENKRLKGEDIDQEDDNGEEEYNVYKNDLDEFEDKNSQGENLIETLYKQKNEELYEEENLTQEDKETLEEINKQTEEIFREKVKGQSVEYDNNDLYNEDFLEERRKRRGKGKHSK